MCQARGSQLRMTEEMPHLCVLRVLQSTTFPTYALISQPFSPLALPPAHLFVPLADIDRIALSEQASSPRALTFPIKESNECL